MLDKSLDFTAGILQLQDESIVKWKKQAIDLTAADFMRLVEENHAFNFQLWQAEDRARREDKGFEFVYRAKRAIDAFNQERNNRMEAMDAWFFAYLKPDQAPDCPRHSETPGMMIDRLSILGLKIYHMQLQTERDETEEAHRQRCQQKLEILRVQRQELQLCLAQLLFEVQQGTRSFRIYQQFKMYNDPKLNPELYAAKTSA